MLKICRLAAAYVLIYKCNIVAMRLGLDLETVEHSGEVFVRKSAALLIDEEYANIIGAVCLERSGGGICHVPQLIRKAAYSLAGLLANIWLTVERLADRRDRHAAALGNFLHRNHERVYLSFSLTVYVSIKYLIFAQIARVYLRKIPCEPQFWDNCTDWLRKFVYHVAHGFS